MNSKTMWIGMATTKLDFDRTFVREAFEPGVRSMLDWTRRGGVTAAEARAEGLDSSGSRTAIS